MILRYQLPCLPRKMAGFFSSTKKQRHRFANKGPSSQGYGFSSSQVWMWELDSKESWVPKNWCFWTVVLEKTLESPLDCREIQLVNPKGNQSWIWCWNWNSNTLAMWWEEPTHWKRPWCWERLKVGGEGDDRGWDGWMASFTQWTWVWASSGSWWWTGRPGMLQSMGSKRVGYDWASKQQPQSKYRPRLMIVFANLKLTGKVLKNIYLNYKHNSTLQLFFFHFCPGFFVNFQVN